MGKMSSLGLNASMFQNYKESVQWFVRNNQGFTFINQIRGTPVYLKKFQSEVLAMVKQLGFLTFFFTLSCVDLRWNDLVEIIAKLKNMNMKI